MHVLAPRTYARLALRVLQQRAGADRPVFATFFVTDRCNVRCDGCVYYDGLEQPGAVPPGGDDTARAVEILRRLADDGIPVVALAGGEPMLREDLPEILEAGKSFGLSLSLITNAIVLHEGALPVADHTCDSVVFSPHPPSELGGNGAEARWERAWEGFARLRRTLRKAELTCAITLGKHTADRIDEIVTRALTAGADRIKYQPNFFRPQFPERDALGRMRASLERWTARHPARMDDPSLFLHDLERYFGTTPAVGCTASRKFNVGVHLDGTVSACCAAHVPIGNLFERAPSAMTVSALQHRGDCFGCHRTDVKLALRACGPR